ncbi:hypothetical protein ACRRTK_005490 [Alexandromys fortis]
MAFSPSSKLPRNMDDSKNSSITKAPQHGGGAASGELLGWNPLQLQSHLVLWHHYV